ncbi:DUF6249 domain-containing protein [Neptunicella sp. SCSIO 80796]|uniref:DUF6249 domain-containing protein n=1 Tax=Neptunicella plasticusilytica TaxID=3117012 RepID=UPI003A4D1DC8
MQGSEEVLVPLIVFTSITLIIGWILLYQFSKKQAFLRLLEKQPGLQPESIKAIGQRLFASNNDLRKGIFCVVIACAIWGFSLLTHFHSNGNLNLNHALYGIGLFPFFGGIAYLILYHLERN